MEFIDFLTSFFETTKISVPEAIMFVCFGMSWPVSIIKALKTKKVTGKSPLFMALIAIGYFSGITHKALYSRNFLVILYLFNLSMILIDLWLYAKYTLREKKITQILGTWTRTALTRNREAKGQLTRSPPLQAIHDHILFKNP
jgi:hypothetical protein